MLPRRALAIVTIGALCWAGAARAVVVRMAEVAGQAGDVVEIVAALEAGGASVAGTQNDLEVRAPLSVARRANGRPDCDAEPSIDKQGTAFSVAACDLGACERLRALVLALDNLDPIPDGAVLYRCRVEIDAAAESGVYPLAVINVGASDPQGNALPATGIAGSVSVGGPPAARVEIADAATQRGEPVDVGVRLRAGQLQTLTVEIVYARDTPLLSSGAEARPSCAVATAEVDAAFLYLPQGCDPDADCTAVRAALSADSTALPIDVPLFTCRFRPVPVIPAGAYALDCGAAFGADAGGHAALVSCGGGTLQVLSNEPTATPMPTGGSTTPTRFTPTATAALQATATLDPCGACPPGTPCQITSSGPVCIILPVGGTDDDGCAVSGGADAAGPPLTMLLLPAALWLAARARSGRRRSRS